MALPQKRSQPPDARAALARLTQTPLASLYLFYGEEDYFIERAIATVCRRVGGKVVLFHAGEDPLEKIVAGWQSGFLFAQEPVVVVRGVERWTAKEQEALLAALRERKGGPPLLFCGRHLDRRQGLFAYLAREGIALEFPLLFPSQLPSWIHREAKEKGYVFTEEAVGLLVDLVGVDLRALRQEMDKVCLFVEPKKRVEGRDVALVVSQVRVQSVFELSDAVGRREGRRALLILRKVLAEGESPLGLLGLFVSHLRRVWWGKELAAQGKKEEEVGAELRLWKGRLRAVMEQGRLFSIEDLAWVLCRAAEIDLALKSGREDPGLLLENWILSLCTPAAFR